MFDRNYAALEAEQNRDYAYGVETRGFEDCDAIEYYGEQAEEVIAVGTRVRVDESQGIGRSQWEGFVTHNDPSSPYITVGTVQVRKYEVEVVLNYSKPVEVYYNLHLHTYSVRQGGIVVLHTDTVDLVDVRFVVQPAGRAKVLATGVKNVHAFVRGLLAPTWGPDLDLSYEASVTYNPKKYATFVRRDTEQPVHTADYVALRNSGKPSIVAGGLK